MKLFNLLLVFTTLISAAYAQAEPLRQWNGRLGASWGIGKMGAGNSTVEKRTMNTIAIDAMPSFRFSRIAAGLDFSYRFVNQNTRAGEVADTNLRGKSWLLGPAATYFLSDQLSLTATLELLGDQKLALPTSTGYQFKYRKPLGFKLGGDYRLPGKLPLFAGASFDWVKYRGNEVNGAQADLDPSVKHWNLALSIAYVFGLAQKPEQIAQRQEESAPPMVEEAPLPKASSLEQDLAQNFDAKRDESGNLSVQLSGGILFAPYKTDVSQQGEAQAKLQAIAAALKKNPSAKVLIEGHSDTSGKAVENKVLSQRRAVSVKKALAKMGVAPARMEAVGLGSERPQESNDTAEGRAANRRVEIHFTER